MDHKQLNDIKAINKEAVHRICSGQVVLNLAIAVKELVENSLDAGATVVEVRLREYGSELIEVTDNGSGVEPNNFQGLTLKHHTSKLQDFSDLVSVETFGFRGEALSSLCSLSDLTVTTRHTSSDCGTRLMFDHNGQITSCSSVARQVGTTVSIENIFSTLPVRQKEFHRNLKREFGKMTQLLYAYCLVSTGIKITCTNQTKKGGRMTVVSTQSCKTVRENIASVFGTKQVMKAVNEVYHQYNMHQQPFVFLNVRSARDSVDVNVTPDKRQVFLEHEKLLVATVKASLQALYEHIPSTYMVNKVPSGSIAPSQAGGSVISSPQSSPASILSQWRHHSATKRPVSDEAVEKLPKQAKLDTMFSKKDQTASFLNGFKIGSNSPNIQVNNSKPLVLNGDDVDIVQSDTIADSVREDIKFTDCKTGQEASVTDIEFTQNSEVNTDFSLENSNHKVSNGIDSDCELSIIEKTSEPIGKSQDFKQDELDVFSPVDCSTQGHAGNSQDYRQVESAVCASSGHTVSIQNCKQDEDGPASSMSSSMSDFTNSPIDDLVNCAKSPSATAPTSEHYDDLPTNTTVLQTLDVHFDREDIHDKRPSMEVAVTMADLREHARLSREKERTAEEARVKFRVVIDPSKNKQAEQELSREISKDMFNEMEVVGQFNLGFIIARLNTDLFIVDQHATDEKYNFETLQRTTTISNQKLVVPQQLELTTVNEAILMDNVNIFSANGFEFKIDENAPPTMKVKLTSIPMSRNWTFGKEDIDELLFMLQDAPNTLCRPSRVRAMFASRACRKSVMIGSALSRAEMKRLLVHMGEIEQPWNCPHGRPTMRHLINLDFI